MSVSKSLSKYFLVFYLASTSLLCIPTLAQALTYYVAESGNDSNLGTEAKPWRSIDKAADTMVAGDTVYIREGNYSGVALTVSGKPGKYISYLAYPGDSRDKIIVDGGFFFYKNVSYIKIDGLTIQGDGTLNSNGIELAPGYNHYNIFSNNVITRVGYAIDFGLGNSKGNVIDGNIIFDNAGCGIHTSGETIDTIYKNNIIYNNAKHGFGQVGGIGEKIINNIVYNNKYGILFTASPENGLVGGNLCYNNSHWEVAVFDATNFTVVNNTAHSKDGEEATYFIEGSGHTLKNNIGYRTDGSSYGVAIIPSGTDADYNCWYDPNNPDPVSGTTGSHSIIKDPKFVDPTNRDYHLQSDSPCKGAGENGVDMGAYGYRGPRLPLEEQEVRNRPNPFRAGKEDTLIEYNLEQPSNVTITIYDLLGQEVWRKSYKAGENGGREDNSVPWDGRNLSGEVIANGGYICRIWVERENKYMVRKIAVAK